MSWSLRTRRIVSLAIVAAYTVAGAGAVALVTIGPFFSIGQPWGTINDASLLVMTLGLAPLMLAFYELGGWTPTPLAQAAQALGWIAIAAWSATQFLMIIGLVDFVYDAPASGGFAVEAGALVYIGGWIAGANLLAGEWLGRPRAVGIVAGIGTVVFAAGLLLGGLEHPLTLIGGLGYQVILPIWAFLMARLLRSAG